MTVICPSPGSNGFPLLDPGLWNLPCSANSTGRSLWTALDVAVPCYARVAASVNENFDSMSLWADSGAWDLGMTLTCTLSS